MNCKSPVLPLVELGCSGVSELVIHAACSTKNVLWCSVKKII